MKNTLISWAIPKILISPKSWRVESIDSSVSLDYVTKKIKTVDYFQIEFPQLQTLGMQLTVIDDLPEWYWPEIDEKGGRLLRRAFVEYRQGLQNSFNVATKISIETIKKVTKPYSSEYNQFLQYAFKNAQQSIDQLPDFELEVKYRETAYCVPGESFSPMAARSLALKAYAIFAAEYWVLLKNTNCEIFIISPGTKIEENRYRFAELICKSSAIKRISPKI